MATQNADETRTYRKSEFQRRGRHDDDVTTESGGHSARKLAVDDLAQVKLYEIELAARSPTDTRPEDLVMTW